jgi:hypothetical protein
MTLSRLSVKRIDALLDEIGWPLPREGITPHYQRRMRQLALEGRRRKSLRKEKA